MNQGLSVTTVAVFLQGPFVILRGSKLTGANYHIGGKSCDQGQLSDRRGSLWSFDILTFLRKRNETFFERKGASNLIRASSGNMISSSSDEREMKLCDHETIPTIAEAVIISGQLSGYLIFKYSNEKKT